MKIIFLTLALLFLPVAAHADMTITNIRSFETAEGQKVGAVLFDITNKTDTADELIKATATSVCGHVELHTMKEENGIMRMREIPFIAAPKGEVVKLTHDGLHIMLMDLKAPLKPGQTFPLTLQFKHAGEKVIDVKVESRAALNKMMNHD
jgi:periplasmic copper chaperone A